MRSTAGVAVGAEVAVGVEVAVRGRGRAGWERLRVYAELGVGFEGILLAGTGWRF